MMIVRTVNVKQWCSCDVDGYVNFYLYILCCFFMWNAVFNGHNMGEKPKKKFCGT